jgi:hypothetical protein
MSWHWLESEETEVIVSLKSKGQSYKCESLLRDGCGRALRDSYSKRCMITGMLKVAIHTEALFISVSKISGKLCYF